jgi:hypothetical protein
MKYVKLIVLVLITHFASAQSMITASGNEPFIEVKVSDTIMAKPDFLKILIEIQKPEEEYDYWDDYSYDSSTTRGKKDESKKQNEKEEVNTQELIKKILDNYKLSYIFHEENKGGGMFSLEPGVYSNAFEVTLNDISIHNKLMDELNMIENTKNKVASAEVKNKHPYELKLVEKLMKKANLEAQAIAKAMGVELDKPLNVSNQTWSDIYSSMFSNPQSMGGMGALFSMMGNLFKSPEQQTKVVIDKSLVIRYGYK